MLATFTEVSTTFTKKLLVLKVKIVLAYKLLISASLNVDEESNVSLQTTLYEIFEPFLPRFETV